MRVPGRKFVRRVWRPLSRVLAPGAVVLGYHRVADASWDPLGLAVSPRRFAEQVEALKAIRTIVSLGSLAELHGAGEPMDRYAAITFDDGYVDFAQAVLPVVESYAAPVTVFVATGFIGKTFWWDEIAALMSPARNTSQSLEIYREDGDAWHYDGLVTPEKRAAAVRDICDQLACRDQPEIHNVLEQLRAGDGAALPPDFGAMSALELETVARHPLVEVGAHTVSHGCLGTLGESDQRAEISRSKTAIEALPGVSARVFSYPNGSFSAATPGVLRSLGFSCACTSRAGVFNGRTDRYRIPRIWTPNVDGPAFRRWLKNWVAGIA